MDAANAVLSDLAENNYTHRIGRARDIETVRDFYGYSFTEIGEETGHSRSAVGLWFEPEK